MRLLFYNNERCQEESYDDDYYIRYSYQNIIEPEIMMTYVMSTHKLLCTTANTVRIEYLS